MPNVDRPSGFRPVRRLDGAPWQGSVKMMIIETGDTTAVYVGDVVKHGGDSGDAGLVIAGMDCEGIPVCARVTAGTTGQDIAGVVVGFKADPTDLTKKHRAASTARVAMVCPVQGTVFEVQEDADTTPVAAASIGLNAAFSTTAGSATTGISGMELDSNTVATTATLPLKVVGLVKRPDNAFNTGGSDTDQAKFEVMFNTYVEADNLAGV